MSGAAIEVHGLVKRFGAVEAVRNATFTATSGRITGFLGPNGAGKTTTLRMLLGLIRPSEGSALIQGKRYQDHPSPGRLIGAVIDLAGAHPGMTAGQHLRTYCALSGLSPARADTVLELTGIRAFASRRIRHFSTGMRQRLALATALLGDPAILVLDEPANGLDPEGIIWLRAFLRDFAASGRTVLLSSHALGEVERTVDDIVLINQGRVTRTCSMTEIRANEESLEDLFLRVTRQGVQL